MSALFLDLHIEIDRTKLYDKRDNFTFPIVNFPFICIDIPAAPPYGIYISQLIQYSRACGSYHGYQELLTLSEHPSSPLIFSGVHNTQSSAFCGMFCRPLLVLFLFGYFGVCHSIYGFWLHLCLITLVWLHLCYPCLITLVSDYSSLITLVWLHLCLIILVLDYPCLITLVFDYHLFKALLRHFNKHTGLTRGQHFVYKNELFFQYLYTGITCTSIHR
jgi:hypothetical protein